MNRPRWLPFAAMQLFLALALLLPSRASAEKFYSMDILYDALVEIDTDAASVTFLGWVGFPVVAAAGTGFCMTLLDGQIYWSNATLAGPPIWLADVDPSTLTFGTNLPYTMGGSSIEGRVEDLSRASSGLVVAIGLGSGYPRPQSLADLALTGEISNLTDYSSFGIYLDRFAVAPDGAMYALERSGETGLLYQIERPAAVTFIGEVAHLPGSNSPSFLGMDFDESGDLWLMEEIQVTLSDRTINLRRLNPNTATVLEEVTIVNQYDGSAPGSLHNLARIPGPIQNETTTWGRVKGVYRAPHKP